jgi:nicotinate-nucleotide pyrophosphorylase (carboxylating)
MNYLDRLIKLALAEDIGKGDVTTKTFLSVRHKAEAYITAKQPGIIAGLFLINLIYKRLGKNIKVTLKAKDGAKVKQSQIVAVVKGPADPVLAGERTVLNFLQRLSGIATLTNQYVQRVKKYGVTILDTRKTVPGWRELDKYAVKTGGGTNHRMGLYDSILVKNNHLNLLGGMLNLAMWYPFNPMTPSELPVEIEVRNLNDFRIAAALRPDIIMLDNMTPRAIKKIVHLRNKSHPNIELEVSGGINLGNIRKYAATGIDYISIGALTHSAPALDIAMHIV